MPIPTPPPHRTICYGCLRPEAVCYCERLEPVQNRTPVVIVQHPRERRHPLGTVRIAERCLSRVQVEVDYGGRMRATHSPLSLPSGAALLYPSRDAQDLADLPAADRPRCLVVIDGTWHHARTLYRDMPQLHSLPKVRLSPTAASRYRIRKEPKPSYLSTVEAIVQALRLIEPETSGLNEMLDTFVHMIDLQIAAAAAQWQGGSRDAKPPRDPARCLPSALRSDFERVVFAYGEAEPRERSASQTTSRERTSQPVCWVAERLSGGQQFAAFIEPRRPLDGNALRRLQLSESHFEAAISLTEARSRWQSFIQPRDIVLTWGRAGARLLSQLGHPGSTLALRGPYRNFHRRIDSCTEFRGGLAELCAREGIPTRQKMPAGRAGIRLGQLEALARLLHERAGSREREDEGEDHQEEASSRISS